MLPFSVLVPPAKFSVPALVSGLLLKLCVPPSICRVAPAAVVKLPLWVPPPARRRVPFCTLTAPVLLKPAVT